MYRCLHSYTNTISAGGGRLLLRPTVINCFEGNSAAKRVALRLLPLTVINCFEGNRAAKLSVAVLFAPIMPRQCRGGCGDCKSCNGAAM
jgi:hypothetical protein